MSGFRLPSHPRNQARALPFRFDGRALEGRDGDTLAAALLANGAGIVGRSFKYRRPRGIVGHGFAETNALVQLGTGAGSTPNLLATRIPLTSGLEARSVRGWPSAAFDVGGIVDRLSPLLSAGFYYKTFIWPHWGLFEPAIRRAAGLGHAPVQPDGDRYEARERTCDVLVIGGGVAGMAAALAAAEAGAKVVLVEADPWLGGATGAEGASRLAAMERAVVDSPDIALMRRTTAVGYYDHNLVAACEEVDSPGLRQRVWKIRAGRCVLACGALERPLLFGGNDRPGVMLAESVRHYLARHGVAAGRRPLFVTASDSAYRAAIEAKQAGLDVVGLVDLRDAPGPLAEAVRTLGIELLVGHDAVRTRTRRGRVSGLDLLDRSRGRSIEVECDLVAMSGGWTPAVQLFSQSGGRLRYEEGIGAFVPEQSVQAERSCGAARGVLDLDACIADGRSAGLWAATGKEPPPVVRVEGERAAFRLPGAAKAFVDFQTDVTVADMQQATCENYRSVEHVKRYTVWGMGTDQGRLSAVNGIAVLAHLQGRDPGAVGTTRFRPPFAPVAFGAIAAGRPAGALFTPWKRLPAHDWHEAQGACFEDHGWLRPSHYPRGAETMAEAAARETLVVRHGVGLVDSSSLGKLELKGPDAGRFLDLVSLGSASRTAIGGARYNLLLDELGILFDDGMVARLGADHFLLTTGSAHAERTRRWLEQCLQCLWPLDLVVQDVTGLWATFTVAGPRARSVMERTGCDVDFSRDAFPHHRIRLGEVAGAEIRIVRASFTGEISFEISVRADQATSLAEYLMLCGEADEIAPVGLEGLDVLRLEKGYFHIGSDTDSRTMPGDVGFGSAVTRKPGDFIGRRSLLHPAASASRRPQLVGLQPVDPEAVVPIGAHVVGSAPRRSRGVVTSSAFSPTLGRSLGLALVEDGRAAIGSEVELWSEGRSWRARIAERTAYDPTGARLDA
ncbi:FAD-dependent oxidoreductase [Sphingosinicella terrae]|uniref:FAD-dependent oxidoreductase n=1 Tax=Sphingosinicella terrae TaxID=2172047 RepID=UPI000E0D1F97|nr:FAD-dependent oxidoreductase [Sphingosinicella terrae]